MLVFAGLAHGHAWSLVLSGILVNGRFPPKHMHRCSSKRFWLVFSSFAEAWIMHLLFSEMEAQDSKTSQSQKRLLALKWGGSSSQIHSSQTSELDDILLLKNIRWSASHLGFSSWYKHKKLRSTDCFTNMTFNRSNSGPVPLLFLQGIKCQAIAEGEWYSDSSPTILTKQIQ